MTRFTRTWFFFALPLAMSCRLLLSESSISEDAGAAFDASTADRILPPIDAADEGPTDAGSTFCDLADARTDGAIILFCHDFERPIDAGWAPTSLPQPVPANQFGIVTTDASASNVFVVAESRRDAGLPGSEAYTRRLSHYLPRVLPLPSTLEFDLYLDIKYVFVAEAGETAFGIAGILENNPADGSKFYLNVGAFGSGAMIVRNGSQAVVSGASSFSVSDFARQWKHVVMRISGTAANTSLRVTLPIPNSAPLESVATWSPAAAASDGGFSISVGPTIINTGNAIPEFRAYYDNVILTVP